MTQDHARTRLMVLTVLGLLAVGVGWIVASLQVYLRDTVQLLTVVMTLWFWMTPIPLNRFRSTTSRLVVNSSKSFSPVVSV